jgi:hypothetical protein
MNKTNTEKMADLIFKQEQNRYRGNGRLSNFPTRTKQIQKKWLISFSNKNKTDTEKMADLIFKQEQNRYRKKG